MLKCCFLIAAIAAFHYTAATQDIETASSADWITASARVIAEATEKIKTDPRDDAAYLDRALAYRQIGDHAKALADLERAIDLQPLLPYAYHVRGSIYAEMKKYDLAISDLTKSIANAPKRHLAYQDRARTYAAIGEYDLAVADLTKVLELDPEDILSHFELADVRLKQKRPESAIEDYNRAIEKIGASDSLLIIAYPRRAAAFYEMGEYGMTVADLDRILKLYPAQNPAWYSLRARSLQKLGRIGQARADHDRAVDLARRSGGKDLLTALQERARFFCETGSRTASSADEIEIRKAGGTVTAPCR